MIREHRLGKSSLLPERREGIKRLGKKRSHILDRLCTAGGVLALEELGKVMGIRPYDLTRRKNSPKGRDGLLVWLERTGILTIEGDTVALTPDWLDRLEDERRLGREIATVGLDGRVEAGADELAEKYHRLRSRAYRYHLERKNASPGKQSSFEVSKPTTAGLEAIRRSHEHRSAGLAAIDERAAAALKPDVLREAKTFVRDRLRELGRIRLALLQDIAHDEGLDPWSIPKAVEALACRVEEIPEFGNRRFVFPPAEAA